MIKVKNDNTYVSIPKDLYKSSNLSFAELGLLSWFFSKVNKWDGEIDTISSYSIDTQETINELIESLIAKGYLEKKKDDLVLRKNPKIPTNIQTKKKETVEYEVDEYLPFDINKPKQVIPKKEPSNLFTKCRDEIIKYTDDEELRDLLFTYLYNRINPQANSRFIGNKLNVNMFKTILHSLDNIENKHDSVQQSIDRQYFKFFEVANKKTKIKTSSSSLDNVKSNTYSLEEMMEIRNKLNEEQQF